MKKICFLLLIATCSITASAQLLTNKKAYSRADSLRGMLTPLRTCYDINFYHLDVKIDIDQKMVGGTNEFAFTATQDFNKLQFDLFENLKIEKVEYKGTSIPFTREFNAVFITFPKTNEVWRHNTVTMGCESRNHLSVQVTPCRIAMQTQIGQLLAVGCVLNLARNFKMTFIQIVQPQTIQRWQI